MVIEETWLIADEFCKSDFVWIFKRRIQQLS